MGAGDFGPSNTLLIDDSAYKAVENPPHTAVHPREWSALESAQSPDPQHDGALGEGGEVRRLLARVAEAADVRDAVRGLFHDTLFDATSESQRGYWSRPQDCPITRMLIHRAKARHSVRGMSERGKRRGRADRAEGS